MMYHAIRICVICCCYHCRPCFCRDPHPCCLCCLAPESWTSPEQDLLIQCREVPAAVTKTDGMPHVMAVNGGTLHSNQVSPPVRPAFGQVQDTALQHDTSATGAQPRSRRLQSNSSVEQAETVSSTEQSTFASGPHNMQRSSAETASEFSPFGASLSDGIPPAFHTGSSAQSANRLAPTPGVRYTVNLATGKHIL